MDALIIEYARMHLDIQIADRSKKGTCDDDTRERVKSDSYCPPCKSYPLNGYILPRYPISCLIPRFGGRAAENPISCRLPSGGGGPPKLSFMPGPGNAGGGPPSLSFKPGGANGGGPLNPSFIPGPAKGGPTAPPDSRNSSSSMPNALHLSLDKTSRRAFLATFSSPMICMYTHLRF
jgi:hypothetical protein